jgi:hypothetical protein
MPASSGSGNSRKMCVCVCVLQRVLITRDLFGSPRWEKVGVENDDFFFVCHAAVLEMSHFARSVLFLFMI